MIRKRKRSNESFAYQVVEPGVRTLTFDRLEDAEDYRADGRRRSRLGTLYVAPAESFGPFLDNHVKRLHTVRNHAAKTRESYALSAKRLEPLRGLPIPALRTGHIEDLVAEVAAEAPRRAQKVLELAKGSLRSAEARGMAVDKGIFQIERPTYDSRKARFLDVGQIYDVASYMSGRIGRIVSTAGFSGMREGELLALEDDALCYSGCVEDEQPHLHVGKGKTEAARRIVHLVEPVVALLKEQQMEREPSPLLFPNLAGKKMSASNLLAREFRPAAVKTGLGSFDGNHYEGIVFHDLKHSFVSIAARSGWSYEHVAAQVGWTPATAVAMFHHYRHLFKDEMKAQVAKLDALLAVEA